MCVCVCGCVCVCVCVVVGVGVGVYSCLFVLIFQYDPMVRLVAAYHSDLLVDTHLHLAKVHTHPQHVHSHTIATT